MKKRNVISALVLLGFLGIYSFHYVGAEPKALTENLYLDAEIPEAETRMKQYEIEIRHYDFQELSNLFMKDQKLNTTGTNEDLWIYVGEGEEGSSLTVTPGRVEYYEDKDSLVILNTIFEGILTDSRYTPVESLKTEAELKEDENVIKAEEEMKALYQLGADEKFLLAKGGCYSPDALKDFEEEQKEIWGSAQDTVVSWKGMEYIGLEYEIEKNGIPVMGVGEPGADMKGEFNVDFPTYVRVLLQDGKINAFLINNGYETIEEKEADIISAEEALEIEIGNYSDIISDEVKTIQEIKLEYIAIPDWNSGSPSGKEWIPYWCFIRSDSEGDLYADRINGVTGGNLAYGE